jgi:hypothetical protein
LREFSALLFPIGLLEEWANVWSKNIGNSFLLVKARMYAVSAYIDIFTLPFPWAEKPCGGYLQAIITEETKIGVLLLVSFNM